MPTQKTVSKAHGKLSTDHSYVTRLIPYRVNTFGSS